MQTAVSYMLTADLRICRILKVFQKFGKLTIYRVLNVKTRSRK